MVELCGHTGLDLFLKACVASSKPKNFTELCVSAWIARNDGGIKVSQKAALKLSTSSTHLMGLKLSAY